MSSAAGTLGLVFPWTECVFAGCVVILAVGITWICFMAGHYDKDCSTKKSSWMYHTLIGASALFSVNSLTFALYQIAYWEHRNTVWWGPAPAFDYLGVSAVSCMVSIIFTWSLGMLVKELTERYYAKHREEIHQFIEVNK